jgi:hypothetical protein
MSAVFVVIFSFKSITTYKNTTEGGCWWLTPTILDTQEDEIGRPHLNQYLDVEVYTCHTKLYGRLRSGRS